MSSITLEETPRYVLYLSDRQQQLKNPAFASSVTKAQYEDWKLRQQPGAENTVTEETVARIEGMWGRGRASHGSSHLGSAGTDPRNHGVTMPTFEY